MICIKKVNQSVKSKNLFISLNPKPKGPSHFLSWKFVKKDKSSDVFSGVVLWIFTLTLMSHSWRIRSWILDRYYQAIYVPENLFMFLHLISHNPTNNYCCQKHIYIYIFSKLFVLFNLQVGLLNVDGYYNSLLSFIDKAVDEGFITPAARHIIVSAQTAQELMSKLEVQHQPSLSIFPYIFFLFEWRDKSTVIPFYGLSR